MYRSMKNDENGQSGTMTTLFALEFNSNIDVARVNGLRCSQDPCVDSHSLCSLIYSQLPDCRRHTIVHLIRTHSSSAASVRITTATDYGLSSPKRLLCDRY